jgi:hypothetical protein
VDFDISDKLLISHFSWEDSVGKTGIKCSIIFIIQESLKFDSRGVLYRTLVVFVIAMKQDESMYCMKPVMLFWLSQQN